MSRYVSNVYNGVLLYREGMLDQDTLDQIGRYIVSVADDADVWWQRWPQPREVEEFVEDYRQRHPGPIPKLHEMFLRWVGSGVSERVRKPSRQTSVAHLVRSAINR